MFLVVAGAAKGKSKKVKLAPVKAIRPTDEARHPIKSWLVLGPFPIGKGELDGDPTHRFSGGPAELAGQAAQGKGTEHKYPSEYVVGGLVTWDKIKADANGNTQIRFDQVDWNSLVQSGGYEILEWQALLVGRFSLQETSTVETKCSGVSVYYLDNSQDPIAGDSYFGQLNVPNVVLLSKGVHVIRTRVRAKHAGQLSCVVRILTSEKRQTPMVLSPSFTPDFVRGDTDPFGGFVALKLENLQADKWLTGFKITISQAGQPFEVSPSFADWPPVPPGMLTSLRFKLQSVKGQIACKDKGQASQVLVVLVTAKITNGSPGASGDMVTAQARVTVRCREKSQVVVFLILLHHYTQLWLPLLPSSTSNPGRNFI